MMVVAVVFDDITQDYYYASGSDCDSHFYD